MSEENEKKIDYKILTAEHLISEKEAEQKETALPKEESVEPEVVKKVEAPPPQPEPTPAPEVSQETMKVEVKSESGVIHPVAEEIPLTPVTFGPSQPEPEQPLLDQRPAVELPSFKPEEFITPKEEPTPPQPPTPEVKPKFEILKGEELTAGEPLAEAVAKKTFRFPLKLILIPVGVVALGFAIFLLKPQKFFVNRGEKQSPSSVVSGPEKLALKLPELKKTTEPLIIVTSETSSIGQLIVATTAETTTLPEVTSTGIAITTQTMPTTTKAAPVSTTTITSPSKTTTTKVATSVSTTTKTTPTLTKPTTTKTTTTAQTTTTTKKESSVSSQQVKTTTTTKTTATTTTKTTTIAKATTTTTTTTKTTTTPTTKTATESKQTIATKAQTTTTKLSSATKTVSVTTPTAPSFAPILTNGELIPLLSAIEKDLTLKALTLEEFANQLKSFFIWQYFYQTLINLKIVYANNIVSPDLIFSYFIKPSKLKQTTVDNFKQSLTNKFSFLIYYGYTRKYPIIIFETKNPKLAREFNNQWMKNGMSQDLRTLFLGINPGKEKSKFMLKKYKDISYNIIYFENNFQIIWSIFNNYLIYASNEESFKQVINDLKKMNLDLNEIREKLLKEKDEIILMLEDLKQEAMESISEPVSASDEIADKYELKQEVHLQKEILEERLSKINLALERLDNNTYGICSRCGQKIEEVRLKIDPATDLCRKCALEST